MKKVHTNKGFTMAELLIVVAIIAILVAIAIPTFGNQLEKSRQSVDISTLREAYAAAKVQELNLGTEIYYDTTTNKRFDEVERDTGDSGLNKDSAYVFKPNGYTSNATKAGFTAGTGDNAVIVQCWYMPGSGKLTAANSTKADAATTSTKMGNALGSKLFADTSKLDGTIVYNDTASTGTLADATKTDGSTKTGVGTTQKGILVVFEKADDGTFKVGTVTYAATSYAKVSG